MANVQLDPRPDTLIIVYVDALKILQKNADVNDCILLSDTSGDSIDNTGQNVRNFNSGVKAGGNVTWVGVPMYPKQTPDKYVIVMGIKNSSGGPNVSGLSHINHMPGQPGGTHMNAQISGKKDETVDYRIIFNLHFINENGDPDHKQFTIDPRLKIH